MNIKRAREDGRYSEGICSDGAAILYDGVPLPIEEIIRRLNAYEISLARLEASGHAPECGVNRCDICLNLDDSENSGTHANWHHKRLPGQCTPNCWQHPEWEKLGQLATRKENPISGG